MRNPNAVKTVFIQVLEFPARKVILKRGSNASDYLEYINEVGYEVWEILCHIKEALYEPVGMWLPDQYHEPNTSIYLQGVEVPFNFCGVIPEGFEIMDLPATKMMLFQSQPFDDNEHKSSIQDLWSSIEAFDPKLYGFDWDIRALRIQLEPQGYRGCIVGCAVKEIAS